MSRAAFAPGIYFGLPDAEYHADLALGSTDIRRLLRSAPDFWWHSSFNPARPSVEPTPAQSFGRAVHRFVLEGRERFEAEYGPTDLNGSTKDGKAERAALAEQGRIPLKREDYDRILVAGTFIRSNPHLAEAFVGGFSEVSVFWERDGVPLKCRFDYLKLRAIADLKSIRNSRGLDFVEACRRSLAEYRYDIQAAHYADGRRAIAKLLGCGAPVVGGDPDWLDRVAATDEFAFVFVFYQAEDAPITWATSLSPGNPILDVGRRDIERALTRYREFLRRFGADRAWVLDEPVTELDINEMPMWWARAA